MTVTLAGVAVAGVGGEGGGREGAGAGGSSEVNSTGRPSAPRSTAASVEPGASGAPVPRVGTVWPVGARPTVVRGWNPPATPYGPGHRGVDLAASSGSPVRAVAPGTVVFAGRVAGQGVVSVALDGTGSPALRTTYEPVRPTVERGDRVTAGQVVGVLETGAGHCTGPCLHWGLRRASTYLDPLSLLSPTLLRSGPSRLLPVIGVPELPQTD